LTISSRVWPLIVAWIVFLTPGSPPYSVSPRSNDSSVG
jgi:hypothetical protein